MKLRIFTLTLTLAAVAGVVVGCGDSGANNSRANNANTNANVTRSNMSNGVTNMGTDNANVGAVVVPDNKNGVVTNMNSRDNRTTQGANTNMKGGTGNTNGNANRRP